MRKKKKAVERRYFYSKAYNSLREEKSENKSEHGGLIR